MQCHCPSYRPREFERLHQTFGDTLSCPTFGTNCSWLSAQLYDVNYNTRGSAQVWSV
jgi:hypothetical protein